MNSLLEFDHITTNHAISGVLIAIVAFSIVPWLLERQPRVSLSLRWVGPYGRQPKGPFERSWASWSCLLYAKAWLIEGYQKYTKTGSCYAMLDIDKKIYIAVPPDQAKWYIDRKDNATSIEAAMSDKILAHKAWPKIQHNRHVHTREIIRRHLNLRLDSLTSVLAEEVRYQLDVVWKHVSPEEWTEIRILGDMRKVMTGVSCRAFFGSSLCRENTLINAIVSFHNGMVRRIWLELFIPRLLKPLLQPLLFNLPRQWDERTIVNCLLPAIKQRMEDLKYNELHPESSKPIPEDFFTWHYRHCKLHGNAEDLEPERIALYVFPILFVSTTIPAMDLTNVILNIVAADGVVEELRKESSAVLEEHKIWTRQGLDRLYKTDSAIRESLRYSLISDRAVERGVVPAEGIYNEAGNWTAPQDSIICLDALSRHRDPSIYPKPHVFDAYRFSRKREELLARSAPQTDASNNNQLKQLSLTALSDSYYAFGMGSNACPGRFYIDRTFKLIVASILERYDIKPLAERPANTRYATFETPSPGVSLKIRRRRDTCAPR